MEAKKRDGPRAIKWTPAMLPAGVMARAHLLSLSALRLALAIAMHGNLKAGRGSYAGRDRLMAVSRLSGTAFRQAREELQGLEREARGRKRAERTAIKRAKSRLPFPLICLDTPDNKGGRGFTNEHAWTEEALAQPPDLVIAGRNKPGRGSTPFTDDAPGHKGGRVAPAESKKGGRVAPQKGVEMHRKGGRASTPEQLNSHEQLKTATASEAGQAGPGQDRLFFKEIPDVVRTAAKKAGVNNGTLALVYGGHWFNAAALGHLYDMHGKPIAKPSAYFRSLKDKQPSEANYERAKADLNALDPEAAARRDALLGRP